MKKQARILVVVDELYICELIALYAEKNGYIVDLASHGMTGLKLFYNNRPALVILDIMLPEMDGWEVCKEIRRFDKTPIIILTGKGESCDKLKGFNLGTDDYMVKPCDPNELIARIKAVLRRANPMMHANEIIELPLLTVDMEQYKVTYDNQEIVFPPREMFPSTLRLPWDTMILKLRGRRLGRRNPQIKDDAPKRSRPQLISCRFFANAMSLAVGWRLCITTYFIPIVALVF